MELCLKANSPQTKKEAKTKIFFDVCPLFFDLICLSFALFGFALDFAWCEQTLTTFIHLFKVHACYEFSLIFYSTCIYVL